MVYFFRLKNRVENEIKKELLLSNKVREEKSKQKIREYKLQVIKMRKLREKHEKIEEEKFLEELKNQKIFLQKLKQKHKNEIVHYTN